jgi:hypothetical protein
MSRSRIPIGGYGEIAFIARGKGKVEHAPASATGAAGQPEPRLRAARHTDPKVTVEHYIRRNEQVNPLTAELLDQAFAERSPVEERE